MKIHQEPRGRQKFIHGNMVVVPVDVSNTVTQLRRRTSETATRKATLKRRLKHRHHVYCLNIRPELVRKAARHLAKSPLHKEHHISINSEWDDETCVDIDTEDTGNSVSDGENDNESENNQNN